MESILLHKKAKVEINPNKQMTYIVYIVFQTHASTPAANKRTSRFAGTPVSPSSDTAPSIKEQPFTPIQDIIRPPICFKNFCISSGRACRCCNCIHARCRMQYTRSWFASTIGCASTGIRLCIFRLASLDSHSHSYMHSDLPSPRAASVPTRSRCSPAASTVKLKFSCHETRGNVRIQRAHACKEAVSLQIGHCNVLSFCLLHVVLLVTTHLLIVIDMIVLPKRLRSAMRRGLRALHERPNHLALLGRTLLNQLRDETCVSRECFHHVTKLCIHFGI